MLLRIEGICTDGIAISELVLRPGLYALLGPNGSGKSSLLRVIAGSVRAQGEVSFMRNGEVWQHPRLKRRLGYAPQEIALYEEMRGSEYLLYIARLKQIPEEWIPARIETLCREYQASGWIEDQISEMSTGRRKLLMVLQALLADPDVLLLDEPLESLDPEQYQLLMDRLAEMSQQVIILMANHRLDGRLVDADELIVLQRGRLASALPTSLALHRHGTLEAYYMDAISSSSCGS